MRFGLLTQWFDPEPGPAAIPGMLARGLRDRGHEVSVVTGFPNYPTGKLADGYRIRPRMTEEREGIHVTRTALYPSHRASASSRLLTYGSFGVTAASLGLGSLRGLDALWVNYSPVTLAPAAVLATKLLGVPSVCHIGDLWPDTLAASGVSEATLLGRVALAGSDVAARSMYRVASYVSYISPGVGPELIRRGVPEQKLAYAPMWADEELFHPAAPSMRSALGLDEDRVVLVYAGSLGEAQGLQTLVDACGLMDDPRFVCLIAGSGTAEQALRDRAADRAPERVRFLGRVAPDQMASLLATADAAFIGLNEHPLAQMTMPSKTQSTLAAGCPLLVAGRGDVAQVVLESGAGWCVPSGDVGALASAMRTICGTSRLELETLGGRARRYYELTFAHDAGIDRFEELLTSAARGKEA